MSAALGGRGILVTRPAQRAQRLCQLIAAAGGEPVAFPTLEILSVTSDKTVLEKLSKDNIIRTDMLVFVSPTAVECALAVLAASSGAPPASAARIAAVGRGTARALTERGFGPVLVPEEGADSEALAALPELRDVAGKRILIIRGVGGRGWLAETLCSRGAQVDYVECYRRVRPAADAGPLVARWRAGGIAAVTVTSREALDNLVAMLPSRDAELVRHAPLFAVHARIAAHARSLGVRRVITTGTGDDAMLAALQGFFATVA